MTTLKLHPAAIRAAVKFLGPVGSLPSGTLLDALSDGIHAAIDDHLKSAGWLELQAENDKRCACEFGDEGVYISSCGYHKKEFKERLKSEGWEELKEAAGEISKIIRRGTYLVWVHDEAVRLREALRRVRGEK